MDADTMPTESLGKLLPRVFLPYAQQWAERSGMPFLSRLLVDEHLRALLERYGDVLFDHLSEMQRPRAQEGRPADGRKPSLRVIDNGDDQEEHASDRGDEETDPPEDQTDPPQNETELSRLSDRLKAIEGQYELLVGFLETVRVKMRPLAASLGCCPECLVGVIGCPKCLGQSKVGRYEPDLSLLQSEVVNPLAVRGVPLTLSEAAPRRERRTSGGPSLARTRSSPWPKK